MSIFNNMLSGMFDMLRLIAVMVILWLSIKYFVYNVLAPREWPVAGLKEGTYLISATGTEEDKVFHDAFMSLENYYLDNKHWRRTGTKRKTFWDRNFKGLVWLGGVPGSIWIYRYDFAWVKKVNDAEGTIVSKTARIRDTLAGAFPYVMFLKGAEIGKSMVKINLRFVVVPEVVNPYIALFVRKPWLVILESTLISSWRNFIASFDKPEDVVKDRNLLAQDFMKFIKEKDFSGIPYKEELLQIIKEGEFKDSAIWQRYVKYCLDNNKMASFKFDDYLLTPAGKVAVLNMPVYDAIIQNGVHLIACNVEDVDYGKYEDTATKQQEAEALGNARIVAAEKTIEENKKIAQAYREIIDMVGENVFLSTGWFKVIEKVTSQPGNAYIESGALGRFLENHGLATTNISRGANAKDMIADTLLNMSGPELDGLIAEIMKMRGGVKK